MLNICYFPSWFCLYMELLGRGNIVHTRGHMHIYGELPSLLKLINYMIDKIGGTKLNSVLRHFHMVTKTYPLEHWSKACDVLLGLGIKSLISSLNKNYEIFNGLMMCDTPAGPLKIKMLCSAPSLSLFAQRLGSIC